MMLTLLAILIVCILALIGLMFRVLFVVKENDIYNDWNCEDIKKIDQDIRELNQEIDDLRSELHFHTSTRNYRKNWIKNLLRKWRKR
jgi:cell division protein FtsL